MTLKEKFDYIVECIETLVSEGENDIPQALARETGLNLRLLGDAFQFVSDMTLVKYIRQRRLVQALAYRAELDLAVEDVVENAGFSDAAAFSKACKNEFNLTPVQITDEILKNYPPLSFDWIVSGKVMGQMENDNLVASKKNTICGISAEQFEEIKLVLELGAIYGLNDEEAEFVYRLAQQCKITSSQAAEFYDDFKLQIENGSFVGSHDLYEMVEVACAYNLSVSQTQEIMHMLHCHGFMSIRDLPEGFFEIYFCEENDRCGWNVPYICDIAKALAEYGISVAEIDDLAFHASMFGVDIIEVIENYDKYRRDWDDVVSDPGVDDDAKTDLSGFGYRNIWEFDE